MNASVAIIEDHLDAAGQKLRGQRIVRGAILWTTTAVLASFLAAMAANALGQGVLSRVVLAVWIAVLVGGFVVWILRPLLFRPRAIEVARLIESRIDGLHNGLTNSLLLSRAQDLQHNPWLPGIFDEIAASAASKPLGDAIRMTDLRGIATKSAVAIAVVAVVTLVFPRQFSHGWRQMFSPSAFVPRIGSAEILDVQPGDVTLIAGQPLEVSVTARGADATPAKLFIDDREIDLVASSQSRYAYRLDHVDQSLRYRVEAGGTQSRWFDVTVVRQVKLVEMSLRATPPLYTRQPTRTMLLKGDEIDKTPLAVPQGSAVELAVTIDVPVAAAMLSAGENAPSPMSLERQGVRFSASPLTIVDDTPVAVLLTQSSGQIVAKLPDPPLVIHATTDAAPAIEMKWPGSDVSIAPDAPVKIEAKLTDDYGLTTAKVLMATDTQSPPAVVKSQTFSAGTTAADFSQTIDLKPEQRQHGRSIRVQIEATDNRQLPSGGTGNLPVSSENGQSTSPVFEIRFRDPEQLAAEQKEQIDKLRQKLLEMLKLQRSLHEQTLAGRPIEPIHKGQAELRQLIQHTADTFAFAQNDRVVQKTLQVLALNPAKDAVDLAAAIPRQAGAAEKKKLATDLQSRQRRIIGTLESLLAMLAAAPQPTTQPQSRAGGDLASKADEFKKLSDALKQFIKEEQRILDQTAGLAKKPVDQFDENDKKLLDELLMSQEKMDAFLQEKIADFSKNAEQDMSNASMLRELMEIYSEVTMAKGALKDKALEIAVSLEESGVELAKELDSNIEKWLMDTPDRIKWTMEDPIEKTDTPMAELPKELEDMIGELMEQQEDLFDEMEDTNSNWADSLNKGLGWDAGDGPIANMGAGGVTGNQLPNNSEMGGRSGEGRSGKAQGEFVEESAAGKGGRNTPTRLDPTAYQEGQIKDTSKDPVGGATGGGKVSGQGGAGLEGPVPPKIRQALQRIAQKQAEIRNAAERLDLKYRVGRYDNFKLLESIALMRRVESDINANRYDTALRRRDVMLDAMDTSHLLLSGRINVQHDLTPVSGRKTQEELNDVMNAELPAAWSEALKEYYRKLGRE